VTARARPAARHLSVWGVCAAAFVAAAAASALAASTPASASGPTLPAQLTPNWAGYLVTADSTDFTSITATWKQPAVTCTPAERGHAVSFWVGLGASHEQSALEQAGTATECNRSGTPSYHAWYEIVPGAPVDATVEVSPGSIITASVNVVGNGSAMLFQIKNRSSGSVFTTQVPLTSAPDLSSADWIVEAPTRCVEFVCLPVPLLPFGSISFSRVAALGNGIGGTLTHPAWAPARLELVPSTVLVTGNSNAGATAGAETAGPDAAGSSFQVRWSANALADDAL
jgi:hypothetical protein